MFLLILVITVTTSHGVAITSNQFEFTTVQNCLTAQEILSKNLNLNGSVRMSCVNK